MDLFLHDSLHTTRNMRREFETVWPSLRAGGLLLADDVERNRRLRRAATRDAFTLARGPGHAGAPLAR